MADFRLNHVPVIILLLLSKCNLRTNEDVRRSTNGDDRTGRHRQCGRYCRLPGSFGAETAWQAFVPSSSWTGSFTHLSGSSVTIRRRSYSHTKCFGSLLGTPVVKPTHVGRLSAGASLCRHNREPLLRTVSCEQRLLQFRLPGYPKFRRPSFVRKLQELPGRVAAAVRAAPRRARERLSHLVRTVRDPRERRMVVVHIKGTSHQSWERVEAPGRHTGRI
jgi:hypothetical protein